MKDYRVVKLDVAHRVYSVQFRTTVEGVWGHCPDQFDTYEAAVADMAERQARKDNRWTVVEDR